MRVRNYAKFQNKQYLGNSTTVKESTKGRNEWNFFSGAIDTVIVQYKSYQRWVQGKTRSKIFTRG